MIRAKTKGKKMFKRHFAIVVGAIRIDPQNMDVWLCHIIPCQQPAVRPYSDRTRDTIIKGQFHGWPWNGTNGLPGSFEKA